MIVLVWLATAGALEGLRAALAVYGKAAHADPARADPHPPIEASLGGEPRTSARVIYLRTVPRRR